MGKKEGLKKELGNKPANSPECATAKDLKA